MNGEKIILISDEESAEYKTISGWVSRTGRFFGEHEDEARRHGSTHFKCECGKIYLNTSYCKSCSTKSAYENYSKLEFKEWDLKSFVYSVTLNEYFENELDLIFHLDDENIICEDLKLILCEPIKVPEIYYSYFEDALPDGYDLDDVASPEFMIALEKLNKLIENEKWTWIPGEYRTKYVAKEKIK